MSDAIARVAWALAEHDGFGAPNYAANDSARMAYQERARVALLAIADPTEDMVAAGIAQAEECTDDWSATAPCVAEHIWSAMAKAALQGSPA